VKRLGTRLASYAICEEPGQEKRSGQLAMSRSKNKADMGKKAVFVFLVGLPFASGGCVASSGSRYRPCHQLRMDPNISNAEYDWHCPRYPTD
jgi:hypothetical protein